MGLYFNKDISTLFVGSDAVKAVYMGGTQVWPTGLPVGTTFNFEYTGKVQSVELPPGKYKLQCWGAQGGTSYGNSNGVGSKGGYSEGVLTLNETTTLYVFVGGKGSRGSSTSLVNGGWNGGGASVGYSSYSSSGTGTSYPACGGGATDICTVTSSMSYSSGRTNRSSESLLSRIIVAGGGAGGSSYTHVYDTTVTNTTWEDIGIVWTKHVTSGYPETGYYMESADRTFYTFELPDDLFELGSTYKFVGLPSNLYSVSIIYYPESGSYKYTISTPSSPTFTIPSDSSVFYNPYSIQFTFARDSTNEYTHTWFANNITIEKATTTSTTTTTTDTGYSNQSGCGGGINGGGYYYGTQSSAGQGTFSGEFGYGASQTATNYKFCSGGAGGGWYGGGTYRTDSNSDYISYSGGGSGFVNIAANSSYRPSGYTGLQLDSGTTTAGNTSHPSTSGGTETGHSGNGYAKITVLDGSGGGGSTTASISWAVQTGNWTESSNSSAKDGRQFTSVSPGTSSSTRLRCTFSGVTSITFNCVYNGESSFDYLTVGNLDSTCTRDSYGTSLKGTSGTARDITFSCDSGTHYVEFCYSKDGSVDTAPDCAVVYVKSYS